MRMPDGGRGLCQCHYPRGFGGGLRAGNGACEKGLGGGQGRERPLCNCHRLCGDRRRRLQGAMGEAGVLRGLRRHRPFHDHEPGGVRGARLCLAGGDALPVVQGARLQGRGLLPALGHHRLDGQRGRSRGRGQRDGDRRQGGRVQDGSNLPGRLANEHVEDRHLLEEGPLRVEGRVRGSLKVAPRNSEGVGHVPHRASAPGGARQGEGPREVVAQRLLHDRGRSARRGRGIHRDLQGEAGVAGGGAGGGGAGGGGREEGGRGRRREGAREEVRVGGGAEEEETHQEDRLEGHCDRRPRLEREHNSEAYGRGVGDAGGYGRDHRDRREAERPRELRPHHAGQDLRWRHVRPVHLGGRSGTVLG
mmetsp:Transcript_99769/g.288085  ORF Transcript_99769/g.288085 Transcript_99769/m.288085 type:complete len:362 (+) Transcript_99769:965-2050(+)